MMMNRMTTIPQLRSSASMVSNSPRGLARGQATCFFASVHHDNPVLAGEIPLADASAGAACDVIGGCHLLFSAREGGALGR